MPVPIQQIVVADRDGLVAVGRDDLVRYAGPSQIVASALVLRLFDRAFAELSPDRPPHRDAIEVLTAFPGEGVLDCVEMLTRARTRGRLVIDPVAGPDWAPLSPGGRFWFEVAIEGRRRGYALRPGLFGDDFVAAIVRHQDGDGTPEEIARYLAAKHELIGRLLGLPGEEVFLSTEIDAGRRADRNPTIRVGDHGTELAISFEDGVRYHGRTSIGGLALGFRLLELALGDLSPGRVPERDEIAVRTAFPGPGFRDAIELVTRAVTRGAYRVDEAAAPATAPEGVGGRLWFEVTVAGRTRAYAAVDGAMSEEFVRVGRASKRPGFDAAQAARWTELKETLAATLLSLPAEAVLRRS